MVSGRCRSHVTSVGSFHLPRPCEPILDGGLLDHHDRAVGMRQHPLRSLRGEQPERGCTVIPSTPLLGSILESFFSDYLNLQRGLRPNSITSYADAMRLFLQFAVATSKKKITQLVLDDL